MARIQIDFLYSKYCPNVEVTRHILHEAIRTTDIRGVNVTEWILGQSNLPDHCEGYGSPTILVNGSDLNGTNREEFTESCQVFFHANALTGVPLLEEVINAIRIASPKD